MAGDDLVVRVFKFVKNAEGKTDFRQQMELVSELKGGHHDSIQCLDISPGMSMLVSSGNDSSASIFDLRQKKVIKKITFRDTEYRTSRGQEDLTNFGIRGCFFDATGQHVYVLASKARYRSYLVKY